MFLQGIDPRQSGHFNYRATPAATATAPPLRCTNRGEVIAWLVAWFGVHQTGAQELIGQVPLLTVADLHKVLGTMPQQEGFGGNWGAATVAGAGTTPSSPPSLNLNLAPSPFSSFPARSPTKLDRGAKIKPGTAAHAGAGLSAGSGPLAAFSANIAPTPLPTMAAAASPFGAAATPFLPRFRCGACGRDDHATDNCILGCTSPPTLIHNHSSDTVGLSVEPLMLMGTGHSEGLDLDLLERQLLGGADEDSPMQATAFDSFLDVSFGDATVLRSPVGASSPGAVTQPVRSGHSAAQHAEQLAQHQPPRSLEDTIKEWAVTLSGHISETLPVAVQGGRWVPPSEAIAILQQLGLLEVNFKIFSVFLTDNLLLYITMNVFMSAGEYGDVGADSDLPCCGHAAHPQQHSSGPRSTFPSSKVAEQCHGGAEERLCPYHGSQGIEKEGSLPYL